MFVVVNADAIPDHLRGYTSRFLVQVAPNLFVGKVSRTVADALWEDLCAHTTTGQVTMVRSTAGHETGYEILSHGEKQVAIRDFDGIQLPVRLRERPGQEVPSPHARG